ncbi:MAG: cysteine desulfurase [Candidatus Omnitrophota bacterium]|jgi:cysteine desulfurase/selenocysteine lyase|nr:MAG: cysteine desulfurase [Candidatus Omnitrophota bacterium]
MVAFAGVLHERDDVRADYFPVNTIREDFPILRQTVHGKPLVYLDNAATTQKPQAVIDTITQAYTHYYANIHRGVHWLSQQSTDAYENARTTVQRFIHAGDSREIIFVRGATEGINLIAHGFGKKFINEGDEIIISAMEHHSNIVPWQMVCEETGAKLRVVPINDEGEFLFDEYEKLIGSRTKLVAVVQLSNALGTVNPIKKIIEAAHSRDIPVLVDGAQAVPHMPVDVRELDCDFYVFSGHKLYGPSGIGILYGKSKWLESLPPYQGGGDMILSVSFEKTLYNTLPYKFEAGTPNIVGAIGLGAAIDYVSAIGMEEIAYYERELLEYATARALEIPQLRIIGTAKEKSGVLSFILEDIHPHDIGTILDQEGIAIRTGHHCAQPVMDRFDIPATARASFAFYNTHDEIDVLMDGIRKVIDLFK